MKFPAILRVIALLLLATDLLAGPRDGQWAKVDEAVKNGLPKTALAELEPILTGALADQSYDEAIKALGKKIVLESEIEGNKSEQKILRLQAKLDNMPAEMKPMLEAILAHYYWDYFLQIRWGTGHRKRISEEPGPDLQTWDLARILAEIDRHFVAALADTAKLQATPISAYDALLEKDTMSDNYRPTLFDFLAYEALSFYQAVEQGSVPAEDEFEIDAAGPIFGDVADFLSWQPVAPAASGTSLQLRAIALYQELLRFHQADADRSAFFDADLARLTFGKNSAVGETKDERYMAALDRFIEATANHEISARALAALAKQINAASEPAKAHELAQRGLQAFPDSAGGAMCFNRIQQIESKFAQIETEHVWNAPWPTLNVTYRNITRIHFRAIPVDFVKSLREGERNLHNFVMVYELLGIAPTLEWSAELPATTDFKERTEKLAAPEDLPPGFYAIVASGDAGFNSGDNQLSSAFVWVSDIALVVQKSIEDKGAPIGGFVLNAITGEPVLGATVRCFVTSTPGVIREATPTKTDANGRFVIETEDSWQEVTLVAESGRNAVSPKEYFGLYRDTSSNEDHSRNQTLFFTDRSLYRPGQTIHYKGIVHRANPSTGQYAIIDDIDVTVVFKDTNREEIARAKHKTNDYGSFSGTFIAPRDRLTGRMRLSVEGDLYGAVLFSVEEYKRPKFQVALQAPTEAAKLDAPVSLTGKATAYTGAAIGGAKVKWRVIREVQFPDWCWHPSETKAIAHGKAVTEPDGTFKVQFTAVSDRKVPTKDDPVFVYKINADVTDTTGETHSTEGTIRIGTTALQASLKADEWQTPEHPVKFAIETKSLDGTPQSATGRVRIHALHQPMTVERASFDGQHHWRESTAEDLQSNPSNPEGWELDKTIVEQAFKTDATGKTQVNALLKAGIYRASLETKDRFGKTVTARCTVQVVDPRERHYSVKLPHFLAAPKWSIEPGDTFTALWGTGYDSGRAFIELACNGQPIKSYWTAADRTQELIELPVTEEMRGGFSMRVTYLRENRAYFESRIVDVPWSNKELTVKWESFRSKLLPGQKETWTAVVTGPNAKRTAAEMVAALYDASLDQYWRQRWPLGFGVFRREHDRTDPVFTNEMIDFKTFLAEWKSETRDESWRYRVLPLGINRSGLNDVFIELEPWGLRRMPTAISATRTMFWDVRELDQPPPPDLSQITARKNLAETAFFFPQLLAGDDGVVRIEFTMPEALTQWKFLSFAHDKELRAGVLFDQVVTAKDLMVEPNPPRFVREGDAIEFTVKVSNRTDQPQSGQVQLTFADAASLAPVDEALGNRTPEQTFNVPAQESRSYSWRIAVPDGMGFLTYKAVGATAQASDGEEGFLPVLSRRILVTESLPLPIRGPATKHFDFAKLSASGESDTLRHQSLTVQMVSQPTWYAVMALPYLMEYPYECSEQIFNRLYANALARHMANSDPQIRRVFDLWKNTPARDPARAELEKNQELQSVILEETPWLRQAINESAARRNVGLLFDANRLDEETSRTLRQLEELQLEDGLWSWFPGGRPNEYISLYIAAGFGRLRQLGVEIDMAAAIDAFGALDAWMTERHRDILKQPHPESYVPNHLDAIYLYGRSFFLQDEEIAARHREAVDFFRAQSSKFWLQTDCRMCQAQLAIALQRFGDNETPQAIMRSLKERSLSSEELGMFWRDTEPGWWWYRAPIETQATMIEAFAEVANDPQAVEDCKVWLLKQKQTQDWKTTKATADAVYALLLRGNNRLASDALVEVSLAGETIQPEKVEAGTGFFEKKFVRDEIKPAMGEITVRKMDDGVSWGGVHWQYLEDMANVTPYEGTPLKLKKVLFVKETTAQGQVLKPVTGPLAVGDELVVRIELRTDRDMEYVHLKDQRGSGTEPVNVLSRYRWQDGLGYYESTRDTASHFFIDYLPKGVYVFEYSTRVQLKGSYQTGLAEIQCMYAPEFNSHSQSLPIEVR